MKILGLKGVISWKINIGGTTRLFIRSTRRVFNIATATGLAICAGSSTGWIIYRNWALTLFGSTRFGRLQENKDLAES